MKKILSLILVLATFIGAASVLSSCGAPEDDGAQFSVYLGDGVYDLDPSDYYVSDNAAQLMSLIYEPLFTLNEKGKLKYAAAEDYEVDEEEREIVITLRESYWSDGARVKADDFVYAWRNLILEPTKANPAASLLYDIENAVAVKNGDCSVYELGVEAQLYDITIKYREGADYEQLLKNLACVATAPVREDAVTLASGHWSKSSNTIVTNGAFKLAYMDYDFGVLTIERNLGYHQKTTVKNYVKNVTPYKIESVFSMGDEVVSISYDDLVKNTVFFMTEASLEDRKAHKDDAIVNDLASTYSYVFNTTNKLFANKNVRKALSIALDRAKIIDEITFGKAASGFLSSVSSENIYNKKNAQALISADAKLDEAKALLADVDFTDLQKSFKLTVKKDAESLKIAELAKACWKELGFDVTVNAVDFELTEVKDKATDSSLWVYDDSIQYNVKGAADSAKYSFDVIAVDWQTYSTDAFVGLSAFSTRFSGNGTDLSTSELKDKLNISGWQNAEYDKLIAEAYEATDEDVRAEKLRAAEAMLIDESPIIPIKYNVSFAFVNDELSDVEANGLGFFVLNKADLDNYHDYLPEDEKKDETEE